MTILETFAQSVNELAAVIGYGAIVISLVYAAGKVVAALVKRGS